MVVCREIHIFGATIEKARSQKEDLVCETDKSLPEDLGLPAHRGVRREKFSEVGIHTFVAKKLSLPFLHKGAGPLGPNNKTCTISVIYVNPKTTIYKQKEMFRFKVAANEFPFPEDSHVTKICKTTFPKDFFNITWLKIKDHEYIF